MSRQHEALDYVWLEGTAIIRDANIFSLKILYVYMNEKRVNIWQKENRLKSSIAIRLQCITHTSPFAKLFHFIIHQHHHSVH